MPEKLIEATANLTLESDIAEKIGEEVANIDSKLSHLGSIQDTISKLGNSMAGALTVSLDKAFEAVIPSSRRQIKETFSGVESAKRILLESEKGFSHFVSEVLLGFDLLTGKSGNLFQGITQITYSLTDFLTRYKILPQSIGDSLGNLSVKAINFINELSSGFLTVEQRVGMLGNRIFDLTSQIKVQSIAWMEAEREETSALRSVQDKLKQILDFYEKLGEYRVKLDVLTASGASEEKQQAMLANILETKNAMKQLNEEILQMASDPRFAKTFETIGLKDFRLNLSGAASDFALLDQALIKTDDAIQNKVNIQARLITRIGSTLSTMNNELRHALAQFKDTGEISERRLHLASAAASAAEKEMTALKRVAGSIPDEIAKSFNESRVILSSLKAIQKEMDATHKGASQSVTRFGRLASESFYNLSDAVDDLSQSNVSLAQKTGTLDSAIEGATKKSENFIGKLLGLSKNSREAGETIRGLNMSVDSFVQGTSSLLSTMNSVAFMLGQLNPDISRIANLFLFLSSNTISSLAGITKAGTDSKDIIRSALDSFSNGLINASTSAAGFLLSSGRLGVELKTLEITMSQVARNIAKESKVSSDDFVKYIFSVRDALVKTGISTLEATQAVTAFLRARLPTDKILDLAQAAKNLGVTVSNMTSSEVFMRFIEIIQTGNSALLNALNISTNVSKFLDDYAKKIGKTSGKMLTGLEYQYAIIEGLMNETKTVTGVYETAMTTAGKQLSSMKRLFQEFSLSIGKWFEPFIAKIIFSINKLLESFTKLSPEVHKSISEFLKFLSIGGPLVSMFMAVQRFGPTIVGIIKMLGLQFKAAFPYLILFSTTLTAIVFLFKLVKKAFDDNIGGISDSFKSFIESIKGVFKPVYDDVLYWIGLIKNDIQAIWTILRDGASKIFSFIAPIIDSVSALIKNSVGFIKDIFNGLFMSVWKIVRSLLNLIQGDTENAGKLLIDAIEDIITTIIYLFEKTVAKAAVWAWNLVVNFANGITEASTKVLAQAMTFLGNLIGRFIKPGSPPEAGPLHYIVEWGKGLIDTFIRSFALADFSILNAVFSPISEAIRMAVSAGTLSKQDSLIVIKNARELVAQLVSIYRKTGAISEEIMDKLRASLGEGADEYLKYIRLTLEYEKAQEKLKNIREEVARAEKAGFVPKELRERLNAAEEELKAKEEAMKWQKEYLDAMKETVGLETELANALEKVSDKLSSVGDKMDKVADALSNLSIPDMANEKIKPVPEFEGIKEDLGLVSDEWLRIKLRVREFVDEIKRFIELPFEDKLKKIKDWLQQIPGRINDFIKNITGLDIAKLFGDISKWVTEKGNEVLEFFKNVVGVDLVGFFNNVWNAIKQKGKEILDWFSDLIKNDVPGWFDEIKDWGEKNGGAFLSWFKNIGDSNFVKDVKEFFAEIKNFEVPEAFSRFLGGISGGAENLSKRLRGFDTSSIPVIRDIIPEAAQNDFNDFVNNDLANFYAKISNVYDILKRIVVFVTPAFKPFFDILKEIGDFFDSIYKAFIENSPEIKASFDELKRAFDNLQVSFEPIMKPIREFLAEIGKVALFSVFLSVLSSIGMAFSFLLSVVRSLTSGIPYFVRAFSGIIDIFSSGISIFFDVLSLFGDLFSLIFLKSPEAKERIVNTLTDIYDNLVSVGEGIWNTVNGIIGGVLETFLSFSFSFIGEVILFFARILERLGLLRAGTSEKIKEFVDYILESVRGLWDRLIKIISDAIEYIKVWLSVWFWYFVSKVVEFFGGIIEKVVSYFNEIKGKFDVYKELISGVWNSIWDLATEKLKTFWEGLVAKFNEIKVSIDEFVGSIYNSGRAFVDNLWNGIVDNWENIKAKIKEKLQELRALLPFSEPKDKSSPLVGLAKSGQAIVRNIMEGVESASFADALSEQLSLARNQLKFAENRQTLYNSYVIQRGAFEGAFPNVRTQQDAIGIMELINAELAKAQARSLVGA